MVGAVKRLIFLEDDETIRRYLLEVVEGEYRVEFVCCQRTSEAVKQLEDAYFDGAILDVKVANGNGISIYRKILGKIPGMKVIFLTGNDSNALRREIQNVGPAMVFSKDAMTNPDFIENLMLQLGIRKRTANPV
jgi:DNA-binding NarL/FixJ family response regulator